MGDEVCKKFTWEIKNFSSLKSERIYSDVFVTGGCRWRLIAYPKGRNKDNHLSLYLDVADFASLPSGWRRHTKIYFTIVNQISGELSQLEEADYWYDEKERAWGFPKMLSSTKIHTKNSGFLVNNQVKIVADVNVLEVIGKVDVPEETLSVMETIDVNGFRVLSSQVEFVKLLFEKHPDIAINVHMKNQYLKTGYMNVLLGVTDILRRSPKEISNENLADAYAAVKSMIGVGFKLDWLVKKLNQMQKNKVKEEAGETRLQKIEEELKDLERKRSDLEAQLEKENAEVMAARAPLSLSDDDDADEDVKFKI